HRDAPGVWRTPSGAQKEPRSLSQVLLYVLEAAAEPIEEGHIRSVGGREQNGGVVLRDLHCEHRRELVGRERPARQALLGLHVEDPDLRAAGLVGAFAAAMHRYEQFAELALYRGDLLAAPPPTPSLRRGGGTRTPKDAAGVK